jgi:hypothetical protein
MHRHTVLIMLAVLPLLSATRPVAAESGWQEDQRRCMIYLPIKGDVSRSPTTTVFYGSTQPEGGDADKAAGQVHDHLRQGRRSMALPRTAIPMFDNRLGIYAAVAPVFSKAKEMTISIKPATDPARTLTVKVGNGEGHAFFEETKCIGATTTKSASERWAIEGAARAVAPSSQRNGRGAAGAKNMPLTDGATSNLLARLTKCALGALKCLVDLFGLVIGKLLKLLPKAHHFIGVVLLDLGVIGELHIVQS